MLALTYKFNFVKKKTYKFNIFIEHHFIYFPYLIITSIIYHIYYITFSFKILLSILFIKEIWVNKSWCIWSSFL